MTMRLSMSSFTGTARTLVAVGTVEAEAMLTTVRAAAPRSGRCSAWSEISGRTGLGGSLVTGLVVGAAPSPPEPVASTVAPSASARGDGFCLARWLSLRCSAGACVRGGDADPAARSLACFSARSAFSASTVVACSSAGVDAALPDLPPVLSPVLSSALSPGLPALSFSDLSAPVLPVLPVLPVFSVVRPDPPSAPSPSGSVSVRWRKKSSQACSTDAGSCW